VIDVARFRERFPILDTTTYLINHSLGAMPLAAEERLRDYARLWRERGVRAWGEGWWDAPWRVGGQIGRIIGAPPSSTVMHPNVTTAEAVVLSCFDFAGARRRVVYGENEFPSVRYLYQAQERRGADVVVVEDSVDAIVDAIDERTLLVPVSHVVFKTGELRDVEPIVRRAHEAGAVVVLDAYQSVGVVPLDVTALGVDFTVGGSVKWLCGGPGAAWLYVRPDVAARLEPTFVGWQAHADPFSFAPELAYAEGASRFLTGTPAVPALYAATAGYDIVEEVGVGAIRERSVHLTSLLIDRLEAAGLDVGSPRDPARRGGTVTVAVPEFEAVATELGEREILCDFRPGVGLRLGPHFYNTDSEVEFAASQIADIVESGSYERHLGARARLTAG
jgi:kynureninase